MTIHFFIITAKGCVKQMFSIYNIQQDVHQLVGQAKSYATKIQPKATRDGNFCRFFSNFDKLQLEVADDILFCVAED